MFLIIGELINSTRDEVKEALKNKDEQLIRDLARSQFEAGAEVLDLNAGESMEKEVEDTKWLIEVVQDEIEEARIAIDSANPEAVEVGLNKCNKRPLLNSITNEEDNKPIREIAAKHDTDIIGLAMGEEGMPTTDEDRVKETAALLDKCNELGIDKDRLYIDVIAMSVGSSPDQGKYAIETVRKIKKKWGLKCSIGLSNISFGLPDRSLLNSTFLTLLLEAGLDAALIDPTDRTMTDSLRATEALLGQDKHCMKYLQYKRTQK